METHNQNRSSDLRRFPHKGAGRAMCMRRTTHQDAGPKTVEVTPEEHEAVLDELWSRRYRVQSLRLRGMTQAQIATELKVSQPTVSKDLAYLRRQHHEQFGVPGQVDADLELGEALALFTEVERSALRDYYAIAPENVKDRNACLRTVIFTRLSRLNVLQDQGILERRLGTMGVLHVKADAVRATLVREGLLTATGDNRAKILDGGDDVFDQMLKRVN